MARQSFLKDKRLLLVDDEPDVLETLEDLLAECRIERATNFADARRLLETRRYDAAVLDVMGVGGYDLLKIAVGRNVIAVMLTARAVSVDDIVKSFEDGAAFYIPKEQMAGISVYLNDVFEALEKQKSPWDRWMERMGSYCERTFGAAWRQDDRELWERLPFH